MTQLSVNINKVATVRNTRTIGIPDPVKAAKISLDAGAHGVTVHPRPDQRHIRPDDVWRTAELLKSYPHAEFNIEGNPFDEYMEYAKRVRPAQCTLVPDDPNAVTSDHGWNLAEHVDRLRPIIDALHEYGARVSLFVDPDPKQIPIAARIGADRVEFYTAPYAEAFAAGKAQTVLPAYIEAARVAADCGLGVNAGHDLSRFNLPTFLRAVPGVLEVSIGHAIISDALEFGMYQTVRLYLEAIAV